MLTDVRHALRLHRRTPGFTAVAVITLALGIGGATAIFSVVDGILLRPLPYPAPDALVRVTRVTGHGADGNFSAADYLDVQRQATSLAPVAGYREDVVDVSGHGEAVRVRGVQTTAAFFEVFAATPMAGRFYGSTDRPGTFVAVISHAFWLQHFGGRIDAVGDMVRLNGVPFQIVGIAPGSFQHPLKADVWSLAPLPVPDSPIPLERGLADRDIQYFGAVARLAPGVSLADANRQLEVISRELAEAFPDSNRSNTFIAQGLSASLVGDARPGLLVLLGAVACVLLIACANVAGLMLARGLGRRRELAVRASLGASRARLVGQVLIESLIIALAGGAAGLLAAAWSLDLLVAVAPESLPRLAEVRLDWRVAGAAFAATTLVGIVAGLAPAIQSSRPALAVDLRDGGRTGTTGRTRLRGALVIAEMAVALVLLVAAGLMLTSLTRLHAVDPGFRTTSLVAVDIPLPQARYDEPGQRRFYAAVLDAVRANPLTSQAAVLFPIPLRGSSAALTVTVEGRVAPPGSEELHADLNLVSPGLFQTAGLRLVSGREFSAFDGTDQPRVAVINERLAAEIGGADPVGQRIDLGEWATIVGVVSDVRRSSLGEPPRPAVYLPFQQFALPFMGLLVRTDLPPASVAMVVRAEVTRLDPDLPIGEVRTIEQIIEASTGQPRFRTWLLLAFAGLAVLLAAVGVYGLMSVTVSQRTAEMGVRLALGASPWRVGGLVMRQGIGLAGLGAAIGLLVAYPANRAIAGLLYDTSLTEPAVYAGLTALLLTIAAVACYVPARRAMRVDPVRALRAE